MAEVSKTTILALAASLIGSGTSIAANAQAIAQQIGTKHAVPKHASPTRHQEESITVTGERHASPGGGRMVRQDEPKSVSTVSRAYIETKAAQSNVLTLVQNAPGANVATSDPFGVTNHVSITVRGLNTTEIGYLADGTPQNDTMGGTVFPDQLVDAENVDHVTLQQGSADLDTPVFSDLGGELSYVTLEPTDHFGGYAEGMLGSWQSRKGFVRLNSGLIGNTGIKAWGSFSWFHDRHFNGPGIDNRRHIDAKAVKEWGDGNKVAVVFSWADQDLSQYYEPTLAQWRKSGRSNYYSATFIPGASAASNASYWQINRNMWNDINVGVPVTLRLTRNLTLDAEPYYWNGTGDGTAGSTLSTTQNYFGDQLVREPLNLPNAVNGQATVATRFTPRPVRTGSVDKLTLHWRNNKIVVGHWYEYDDYPQFQDYTALGPTGQAANIWSQGYAIQFPDGRTLRSTDWRMITQVNGIFAGDTMSLMNDHLELQGGVKVVMMHRTGTNYLPGPQYNVGQDTVEPLPTLSARYKFNDENQIFVGVSTGFRAPFGSGFFNSYSTSNGAISSLGTGAQKDEYSIEEELGYRYQGRLIMGSVTFFNYNFTNRQINSQTSLNGALVSSSINAGGQTTRGVDAEISTRPFHHFSPYMSFEYTHAIIDNNFNVGGELLPTKGKFAVETPEYQGSFGLSYDSGNFFGNVDVRYIGAQYSTFMNDQRMPSQTHADLALGYRLPKLGRLHPEFRLNFLNLTDTKYLSGIAAVSSNANATRGIYGTLVQPQGSPSYFIGSAFTTTATLSTDF